MDGKDHGDQLKLPDSAKAVEGTTSRINSQ
jgi:hypothetical protein